MTVLEATKKFLAMSKRTRTITEITDALKEGGYTFATGNPLGTVSAVLHRTDAKGGEVIRVSKGTYGLAEWYPGRAKRKKGAAAMELEGDADDGDDAIVAAEKAAIAEPATSQPS